MNDLVTSADLDEFAEQYEKKRKREINEKINEWRILENMRSDLSTMTYALERFSNYETRYLIDMISKCIDEIERIGR